MYNGHTDVTALLKPDGTIAATYYYDAFGNITDTTGAASNSITFAGYQYDKETGLYYLNSRMYDQKTARFLQEDTYTGDRNDPLNLNLYAYCANNPIAYYDTDGHFFREIRNGFNWFKRKITGKSKQTTSEAAISEYEPDWADKADDFLEDTGDKIKAGLIGFADKFGGEALDKAATRVLFNDWTSDYSNTPDNWKPALTEDAKKKEHNEMLRDQLGKSYNWTPDKSIENAYNAGGIAGQVTQAVSVGKILGAAGVGGQLATWGQKAKLFASTGAISGAVNAFGEGKDATGIIRESAITGAVSVTLGFAGDYVGNQIGKVVQKVAPSVKNFVAGVNRGVSNAGEGTSSLAKSNVMPQTGVERFDSLVVGTNKFDIWKSNLEGRGYTVDLRELPSGNPANITKGGVVEIDPSQFRYVDMLHEKRHIFQNLVAESKTGSTVLNQKGSLKRDFASIAEIDAYRYEVSLANKYGFSQEYTNYLKGMIGDYSNQWIRPNSTVNSFIDSLKYYKNK